LLKASSPLVFLASKRYALPMMWSLQAFFRLLAGLSLGAKHCFDRTGIVYLAARTVLLAPGL
jgi:hypothetical protein